MTNQKFAIRTCQALRCIVAIAALVLALGIFSRAVLAQAPTSISREESDIPQCPVRSDRRIFAAPPSTAATATRYCHRRRL